jgi:hypothetical protein
VSGGKAATGDGKPECHVLKACCSVAFSACTPRGKKHLNGEPVPTHLLLPNQSFCHDLVGCGFDLSRGDLLVGSVELSIIPR